MRYLFLLNPAAGRRDCTGRLRLELRAALRQAGIPPSMYQIVRTAYKGHAEQLAGAAARAAARHGEKIWIWAAGGDGTFNEALRGACPYPNAAVGCIPVGSGNDFLRTFGTKAEFLDLAGQLAGGVVPIDLMDTTIGLSAAVCAAGLDAQVAAGAARFRRNPLFHGEAAYLLSAARELCRPMGRRVCFEVDDERFEADILMCAACNTRDYGGGFRAGAAAWPDDGWIDLVIVRRAPRRTVLRLLNCYRQGRHFAGEALAMATVNGARALGRDTGVIAPGKMADLILVDFTAPNLTPCHDVEENLVYAARGSNVEMNMARGQVIYEKGEFLTLDLERIRYEVEHYALPKIFPQD